MMIGIEAVLRREMPTAVLVQDTNTVLAGALTATKMRIKVGHVEAGLRSGDMSMPEEVNRIVADHVSDYLFAPTETAKANLLREGLAGTDIHVTGNTVVDAAMQNLASRGVRHRWHRRGGQVLPCDYAQAGERRRQATPLHGHGRPPVAR
jgi:UDP-N-acetylglucosamine 2-epimerase (non-hydrolysing)